MAEATFDDLAGAYDRFRVGYADALYDVLATVGIGAGASVLDIGCGTGLATAELVRRGCFLTGADVSESMLERAHARMPQTRFVNASAEELPFADDAFDAASSAQAFHWFDRTRALAEIVRVVRPGGPVAIWWKGLVPDDPTRLLRIAVAADLGLDAVTVNNPSGDLLREPFDEFEHAGLVERAVHDIPWRVVTTPRAFVGYERSRAIAKIAFGDRRAAYLAELERRFGDPGRELILNYAHKLYVGRVPESAASDAKLGTRCG